MTSHAGFFVCKLKKTSNAPRKAADGQEEQAEDEMEAEEAAAQLQAEEKQLPNGKASKKRKASVASLEGIYCKQPKLLRLHFRSCAALSFL